jgi:hypothetical protein
VTARRRRAREKVRGITFWILDLGFGICECEGTDCRGERGGMRRKEKPRNTRMTRKGGRYFGRGLTRIDADEGGCGVGMSDEG